MKFLILIFTTALFFSCSSDDDSATVNPDDPSNLELNILSYNDGTGIVVVSATATNATSFQFFMGDDASGPIEQTTGTYEHTYVTYGSYEIAVRAYGPSGRYLEKSQRTLVEAADPVPVGNGYSTPFSYEGMELVWNDEFLGSSLNEEDWSHDIGNGCPDLCGWGNNELEYYRPENLTVGNGVLTIEAKRESFEGYDYTSSKIVTRNKQAFKYGRIDIRATLPKGQGLWPALWMLGTNQPVVGWPKCGEIDIMEMVGGSGRENTIGGNVFWDSSGTTDQPKSYSLSDGTFADEFHVFSIIWTESEIKWYVDDNLFHTFSTTPVDRSEFQEPFYLIFNVAVGGNWPGSPDGTTVFPTQMQVDYVRVFQEK